MNAGMRTGGCLGRFGREGDPRSRRGRRYPLSGLLGMLILAALHGEKSLRGMWMWGCKHWARIRHPLGFVGNPRPPAYTTVWYVVTALDGDALDEALGEWALSWSVERLRSISVDGKVLRGSRRTNPQQPALEVLTAAAHELKVVLGQRGVPDGDLVAAAVALLQGMPLKGRLVTADAGLLSTDCRHHSRSGRRLFGRGQGQPARVEESRRRLGRARRFSPRARSVRRMTCRAARAMDDKSAGSCGSSMPKR